MDRELKLLGRSIEVTNGWIHVDNFKKEEILIGRHFNTRFMKLKDWYELLLYILMPYPWLNNQFMKGNL